MAPEFSLYTREDEEAKAVINICTDLGHTAILARTNRGLAAFEDECGNRGLRYKLLGKSGFWGQREVLDSIAVVGAIVFPTDANILRTLGAHCEFTRFLRKTGGSDHPSTIDLLKRYQQDCNCSESLPGEKITLNRILTTFRSGDSRQDELVNSLGHTLKILRVETANMPGRTAMLRAIDRFGLLSIYEAEAMEHDDDKNFDNDPRENIRKLLDYASRGTLRDFYDYTQRVKRASLARKDCLTLIPRFIPRKEKSG